MKSLQQLIHEAFSDTQPTSGPITSHRCDECDRVDAILGGRVWSDVANNFPEYCHDCFPLLTPDAQQYFLPAFMLAALRPEANTQGISLETAFEDGRLSPEQFTSAQRAAIVRWAIEYWGLELNSDPPPLFERWRVTE